MPQTTTDGTQIDPAVVKVMQAIKTSETGGAKDPWNTPGDSGASLGAYQWNNDGVPLRPGQLPSHWKNAAQQYLGDANAPMTPDNQNKVAYSQIKAYKDQGKQPEEIAALWNGAKKDPATGQFTYVNPAYGERFRSALGVKQAPQNGYQPPSPSGTPQPQNSGTNGYAPPAPPSASDATDTPPPEPPKSFLHKVGDVVQGAGDFLFPAVGDVGNLIQGKNTKSAGQIAGDVGLSVLPFIPGLGGLGEAARGVEAVGEGANLASKAGLLSKIAGSPITRNAAAGYGMGVSSNLAQGQDLGNAVSPNLNTVGGAVTGGVLGGLLGKLGTGANGLRNSATEDITKVLSPTTKINKQITQKIAPRLANEGVTAMSSEGLLAKYQANMGQVGDALEAEYEKLPANAKIDVSGLFETLNKKIDGLTINGVVPSAAKSKVAALQGVMKDLANIGVQPSADGTQVFADVANVRALRQIVDNNIGKGFAFSDLDTANRAAQKQLANGIREQFGTQYPDIAKLNKDFNFWSNASQVLSDAMERKTGQSGIIRKGIAAGIGMGGGSSMGHPWIGAAVMKTLSDFMMSPAWHTTSALVKSKIANAFEKADYAGAQKLIQTSFGMLPALGAGATIRTLNPQNQITNPQSSTPQQMQ